MTFPSKKTVLPYG